MIVYVVEFAVGELRTTDHAQARQANIDNPGSSMWTERAQEN